MNRFKYLFCILTFLTAFTYPETQAQNWPGFRGPNGDGTSIETNLPIRWDSKTNVVWKSPVPGIGHSSPIIWDDKLFLTSALPETQEKQDKLF